MDTKTLSGIDPLVPTVFHESWWLDAATNGSYEQVEVSDGHRIVGRFPFAIGHATGRRFSTLPTLTHVLGPAVNEGSGSPHTRFLQRYTVTRELIAKLPKLYRFRQKLHAGYDDALSFQAEGFQTRVQFTFEIEPQAEIEVWNRMRNKTRNVIRRAQEQLLVREMRDVEEFLGFYESNLAARDRYLPEPRGEFAAVCTAALDKGAGRILTAYDRRGRPIAAICFAFDAQAAYYLISTRTLDSGNGAVSLLIWSAIQFSMQRNLKFDFDGIAQPGSVLLYAGFGGQPKPRYIVSKDSKTKRFMTSCKVAMGRFPDENFFDYH